MMAKCRLGEVYILVSGISQIYRLKPRECAWLGLPFPLRVAYMI